MLVIAILWWGYFGGRRIDVSQLNRKDHPVFQGPLRADGNRDYTAMAQQLATERGVTDENNLAISLLEAQPDGEWEWMDDRKRAFSEVLAVQIPSSYPVFWPKRLEEIIKKEQQPNPAITAQEISDLLNLEIDSASDMPPEQLALARLVLEKQSDGITAFTDRLENCTHCYYPLITHSDSQSPMELITGGVQDLMNLQPWITLRTKILIFDRDLSAAWESIQSQIKMGNVVAVGNRSTDFVYGRDIRSQALEQLIQLLNHRELTLELLSDIESKLPLFLTQETATDSLDFARRLEIAMFLDDFIAAGLGQELEDSYATRETIRATKSPGWINNTNIMNQINDLIDAIIKELESDDPTQALKNAEQLVEQFDLRNAPSTSMIASPTSEATKSAARFVRRMLFNSNPLQYHCENLSIERILHLVIAIRKYEFQHQALPETPEQLELTNGEILIDPFSGDPWQWQIENNAIQIWGAGPNRKDDRVRRQQNPKLNIDDIEYIIPARLAEGDSVGEETLMNANGH